MRLCVGLLGMIKRSCCSETRLQGIPNLCNQELDSRPSIEVQMFVRHHGSLKSIEMVRMRDQGRRILQASTDDGITVGYCVFGGGSS